MTPTPEVIAAAKASMTMWKVPASVSIAQYGLESGWGQHMPPASNNPFGIKAVADEPFVSVTTREFLDGKWVEEDQPFRVFADLAEAFDAHAELLATAPVYAEAMAALPDVAAFVSLVAPHYATDPTYAATLMEIITGDDLTQYDA